MTCEIIAYLLTRGLETALTAAAAEVVRIQHPKFAALNVCEFSPDDVSEGQARAHKVVRASWPGGAPSTWPDSVRRATPPVPATPLRLIVYDDRPGSWQRKLTHYRAEG
jgi:hypothetical protein